MALEVIKVTAESPKLILKKGLLLLQKSELPSLLQVIICKKWSFQGFSGFVMGPSLFFRLLASNIVS